jgi:hypothetical protein
MNTITKAQILQQIGSIQLMERGTLSTYTFKDRAPDAGPYHKLQCWEQGKNHTRYVPPEQVALVQEALAGYAQFQALTQQLAQLCIAETRQQLNQRSAGVKKKTRRPNCSSSRNKKSSS